MLCLLYGFESRCGICADGLQTCFGGNADGDNRICDGGVVTETEAVSGERVRESVLCFWRGR
jgi:hypothetical protein